MGIKANSLGWPAPASWMPSNLPTLQKQIVFRAWCDIGIVETSNNRSGRIDEFCRRAGCPVGSYWCAAALTCWFADAGADTPPFGQAPGCDEWEAWAIKHDLWKTKPVIGGAIVYGKRLANGTTDAYHIGVVVRLEPYILTIEGNRAYKGVSNNGVAVDIGPPARTDILGYIVPRSA